MEKKFLHKARGNHNHPSQEFCLGIREKEDHILVRGDMRQNWFNDFVKSLDQSKIIEKGYSEFKTTQSFDEIVSILKKEGWE